VFVLAALGRRPFGLRSARAVARVAGVSPTTATQALAVLLAGGLVERRTDCVAEGEPRDVTVWTVRWSTPEWLAVATTMGRVVLPMRGLSRRQLRVPRRLSHLFWNADLTTLDVSEHGRYVADRILRSDDSQALAWLAAHVAADDILAATGGRGMDPRAAALGRLLARHAA
jgi:DNA-binding transcriptional ArsR family regulator